MRKSCSKAIDCRVWDHYRSDGAKDFPTLRPGKGRICQTARGEAEAGLALEHTERPAVRRCALQGDDVPQGVRRPEGRRTGRNQGAGRTVTVAGPLCAEPHSFVATA